MRAQIISPAKWRLSQKMAIDAGRGRPGRPSFGPIWPCHVKCTLRGSTRAIEDLPVRRQPGSSTSSFSFATSTPVVRGDRCAPRRLELSMSPVSPCTTGSQKTVIRLLMVEETFETNFFFFFAPVIASCLWVWKLPSRSTTFRISAFVELNLDCDVGAGWRDWRRAWMTPDLFVWRNETVAVMWTRLSLLLSLVQGTQTRESQRVMNF